MTKKKEICYADDDLLPVKNLVRMRFPSILIGLLLGILLSFITSNFEKVLAHDVKVAFFIPFIVYMADAVGTQTQNIYSRDLRSGHANFKTYLVKESLIGLVLGGISSLVSAGITFLWFGSGELTLVVSLSMFVAVTFAPLVALAITELLELEHSDPAVGAGPLATVLQDTISVLIYGLIASAIML